MRLWACLGFEREHAVDHVGEWLAPPRVDVGMARPNDVLEDARIVGALEGVREHHGLEDGAAYGPYVNLLRVRLAHVHLGSEVERRGNVEGKRHRPKSPNKSTPPVGK